MNNDDDTTFSIQAVTYGTLKNLQQFQSFPPIQRHKYIRFYKSIDIYIQIKRHQQ